MKRNDQPDTKKVDRILGVRWKKVRKPILCILDFNLVMVIAYCHDSGETLPSLDNIVATDSIRIARGGRHWSGLWMICSKGPQLRFVLNTWVPNTVDRVRDGWTETLRADIYIRTDSVITAENLKNYTQFLFRDAIWRRRHGDDILLTPPLSPEQIANLLAVNLPAPPKRISVHFSEQGTVMRGVTTGNAITAFAKRCLAQS
ncbi:hypothetical protein [Hoeflea sp.]|uniref:hypothetical protein n=1 Tax=Hoeflea sp. TaxID=1940281 RepID=UPI002AFE493A|nr:hypothetical protein [Hoeflea sp.]